jgi:hypothetical protein
MSRFATGQLTFVLSCKSLMAIAIASPRRTGNGLKPDQATNSNFLCAPLLSRNDLKDAGIPKVGYVQLVVAVFAK